MKKYTLYIKSGTNMPDYESKTEAHSLREAAENFSQRTALKLGGWTADMLEPYIEEAK